MPRFCASANESSWEYSRVLMTLNFMLFIYMMVVYVGVYKKVTGTTFATSAKKEQNQYTQKRISRLLLTDFMCWIPVCIMAYVSVAEVSLTPNAYIASAGFLLPINSAMSPLLYSPLIGQYMSRVRIYVVNNLRSFCPRHVDDPVAISESERRARQTSVAASGNGGHMT